MTEIATIDWFGRWGTSVFSENTTIFKLKIGHLSFHVHTFFVWYRNESYSEPHCPIFQNLATKVLKGLENGSTYIPILLSHGRVLP